jgi:hypothetical protein
MFHLILLLCAVSILSLSSSNYSPKKPFRPTNLHPRMDYCLPGFMNRANNNILWCFSFRRKKLDCQSSPPSLPSSQDYHTSTSAAQPKPGSPTVPMLSLVDSRNPIEESRWVERPPPKDNSRVPLLQLPAEMVLAVTDCFSLVNKLRFS